LVCTLLGALEVGCGASVGIVEVTGGVGRPDTRVVARGVRRGASIGTPGWDMAGTLMGASGIVARGARRGASIGTPGWDMVGTLLGALIGNWWGASVGMLEGAAVGTEGGSRGGSRVGCQMVSVGTRQAHTHIKLYC
jgi:hypothetical protein